MDQAVVGAVAPYALVVDDNPVILLHATDILADAGFSVFSATDSNTALDWLEIYGDKLVLLFTNVEIPGPYDGFGLARCVAERWPTIAILISSGRWTPDDGDMPNDSVFLPKPFSRDCVMREITRLLATKGSVDALRAC